jgi:hypothetical protein
MQHVVEPYASFLAAIFAVTITLTVNNMTTMLHIFFSHYPLFWLRFNSFGMPPKFDPNEIVVGTMHRFVAAHARHALSLFMKLSFDALITISVLMVVVEWA